MVPRRNASSPRILPFIRQNTRRKLTRETGIARLRELRTAIDDVRAVGEIIETSLRSMVDVLACECAGIIFPWEPDATVVRVSHQVHADDTAPHPETGFEMTPELSQTFSRVLDSTEAVESNPFAESFAAKSDRTGRRALLAAVKPRTGPAGILFATFTGGKTRTEGDAWFLEEIGRLLSDTVSYRLLSEQYDRDKLMYQALFEQAGDAIQILDGTQFIASSKSSLKLLRMSDRSQIEVPPWEISPEYQPDGRSSKDKAQELIKGAFEDGYQRFEWVHLTADGEPVWVEVTLIRIDIEDRPILYSIWRYIGDRKRTESALRDSEERYRELFNTSNEVICVIDNKTFRLLDANDTLLRAFGYTREEALALKLFDFSAESEARTMERLKSITEKSTDVFDAIVKRKNGEKFWLEITALNSIVDGRDCTIAFGRDITQQKESAEAIKTRLRYEKALSDCSRSLLESSEEEMAIRTTLSTLLIASNVCRVYLFRNDTVEGRLVMRQTHEVCAEGVSVQLRNPDLAGYAYDPDFTRWRETFERGEEINGVITEFPESERTLLEPQQIVSILTLPVYVGGVWEGFIGFDDTRHEKVWSSEDVSLLRTAAAMLGAFLFQRRTIRALSESEEIFRAFAEYSPDTIMRFDRSHRHIYVNQKAEAETGIKREHFYGKTHAELGFSDDLVQQCSEAIETVFTTAEPHRRELTLPSGIEVDWLLFPEFGENGSVKAVLTSARDITELKKAEEEKSHLEEELRQAQKMESIGRLAGGIAHDFNNMLTPILGYSELLLMNADESDSDYATLQDIRDAAERAAGLTKQLLAFSRKQMLNLQPLSLNRVISEFSGMLNRLIGENINIRVRPDPRLLSVRADADQLRQVIMNLVVNARDAMPGGGKLLIRTRNKEFNEQPVYPEYAELAPGRYVILSISDTGHGMDEHTLTHIFEPFFTTKETGKGTGLGLSMVYGIIRQHGGAVAVRSRVGGGTTFDIALPGIIEAELEGTVPARPTLDIPGKESIIVVEDEGKVRRLIRQVLDIRGYRAEVFSNSESAIEYMKTRNRTFDLLLTDVILPDMNGVQLYRTLKLDHPDLRVLFMSGYTDELVSREDIPNEGTSFLDKPFSISELLEKVREALS